MYLVYLVYLMCNENKLYSGQIIIIYTLVCFGSLELAVARRGARIHHPTHQSRTFQCALCTTASSLPRDPLPMHYVLHSFVNCHQSLGQLLTQFTSLHNIHSTTILRHCPSRCQRTNENKTASKTSAYARHG